MFLVRKMGDLALHSALDARLEKKKKKKTYLTRVRVLLYAVLCIVGLVTLQQS